MKRERKTRRQGGIALLIAIFVLLLISVVAIALLVSSGTETALGANYRTSSTVYYAAIAGLEEARGRLLPPVTKNPKYFGVANIPTPFPLGQTVYVINRLPGENIVPWDPANAFYDNEYQSEFGTAASGAAFQSVNSVWDNNIQDIPGPIFKWVRINAATEQSLFLQVNASGAYDKTTPIYYDPFHLNSTANPWPSLVVGSTATAVQVLEVTALASLPSGSQKILQYLVAPVGPTTPLVGPPVVPSLSFPSALTMDGNNVLFSVPSAIAFQVSGIDQNDPLHVLPNGCTPGANPVAGVGYTNNSDASQANITSAILPANQPSYTGFGASTPNVLPVGGVAGLAANLQTVSGLSSLVQAITQNADVVINGPATQSDLPAGMSITNPMTVVVNGDLTLSAWHNTGFGILLVTGTFTYDPDASWDGIVLVIGQGIIYSHQGGPGTFYGAMLVANTVGGIGNNLAPSSFNFTSTAGSQGIYYSSCWINYVQAPVRYKVFSFHEIRQ
jgi:hypothetical protein